MNLKGYILQLSFGKIPLVMAILASVKNNSYLYIQIPGYNTTINVKGYILQMSFGKVQLVVAFLETV